MNLDFLTKELVCSYSYSNSRLDRNFTKQIELNGRQYVKCCQDTFTVLMGQLYRLNDSSYLLLVGKCRQEPFDLDPDIKEIEEMSSFNSFDHPVIMVEFDHEITNDEFYELAEWYISNQKRSELYTEQEIEKLSTMRK